MSAADQNVPEATEPSADMAPTIDVTELVEDEEPWARPSTKPGTNIEVSLAQLEASPDVVIHTMRFDREPVVADTTKQDAKPALQQTLQNPPPPIGIQSPGAPKGELFLMPETVIDGRYEVVAQLGSGSFGSVFIVEHVFLGQRFAMKILKPSVARDPEWVSSFNEEARATSLIGHEHIVFVTDFGQFEGSYYFVMEYLDGITLGDAIALGAPFEVDRAVSLAMQMSSALSEVHALGIVHCDLKPANVMLVERHGDEMCKILDFGISNRVVQHMNTDDYVFGTPSFMAPEQTISMSVDGRADQFSVATILYEMLTGSKPWVMEHWMMATPSERAARPPKPPSQLRPGLPAQLDAVVLRALEVDPGQRWPDMHTFAHALAMAAGVHVAPKMDPRDVRPTNGSSKMSSSAPQVHVNAPKAGDSMRIFVDEADPWGEEDSSVEELAWLGPVILVHFASADRVRREWRRNIVAGGMFIPTRDMLAMETQVCLHVVFEPKHRETQVFAKVTSHADNGFGVTLSAQDQGTFDIFLRSLKIGLHYGQDDIVKPLERALDLGDDLGVGEGFIMSRLSRPMRLGELRSVCVGLPFDVDASLAKLAEHKYVVVIPADGARVVEGSVRPDASLLQASRWDHGTALTPEELCVEVRRVLEAVEYMRASQNYLGAMETLYRSIDAFPDHPEFYHQLALLHARFSNDLERAFRTLECALQMAPKHPRYVMTREYLETLQKIRG
ncbi:MAG: serine/threonine-protein kinase [Myxococcota bacterium]